MNCKIGHFLAGTQLLVSLFSFVQIIPLPLDSQPYALVVSFLLFLFSIRRKLPIRLWMLGLVLVFASFVMLCTACSLMGLRSLMNYFSLFFITAGCYISLCILNGFPYRLFRGTVWVWFVVGLIQITIYPSFCESLLLRSYNSLMLDIGRGVTSLAVEPSYYGAVCVLFLLINYLNFRNEKHYRFLMALILVQLFIFSKSSVCILILALSYVIYIFIKILFGKHLLRSLLNLSAAIGFITISSYYIILFMDNRLASILRTLTQDPTLFLTMDGSIYNRFIHAFFPIKGFFDSYGMPHGFSGYYNYLSCMAESPKWQKVLLFGVGQEYRIGTAIGAPLFELGILSLPFLKALIITLKDIVHQHRYGLLCAIIFALLIMNNSTWNIAIFDLFLANIFYLSTTAKSSNRKRDIPESEIR